jgi:hypothetical protein
MEINNENQRERVDEFKVDGVFFVFLLLGKPIN